MSISALFEELGAPLNNKMWSWGAVRESDQSVFLRVWQDGTHRFNHLANAYYTWVSDMDEKDQSLGALERRRHIDLIKNCGYKAFMIMCVADEDTAETRKIKEFDHKDIRVGGKLAEISGSLYMENIGRIPLRQVALGAQRAAR